jgi:hypothetical protein
MQSGAKHLLLTFALGCGVRVTAPRRNRRLNDRRTPAQSRCPDSSNGCHLGPEMLASSGRPSILVRRDFPLQLPGQGARSDLRSRLRRRTCSCGCWFLSPVPLIRCLNVCRDEAGIRSWRVTEQGSDRCAERAERLVGERDGLVALRTMAGEDVNVSRWMAFRQSASRPSKRGAPF